MLAIKNTILNWLDYEYVWILHVFIVVLLTLTIAFFVRRILKKIELKSQKTSTPWDDGLVEALQAPCKVFIWLMGISFAADLVALNTDSLIAPFTNKLREVGLVILLTWFLIRLVKTVERNFVKPASGSEETVDPTTARALGKLVRASIVITSALIVMQSLGYSVSGILAFGGIGGLAVGFAAKDLLANFFGGLTIYLDRPFKVGDWVRSPDKEIEGTVEDIGWRLTRIRTFDKRPLYVPNGTFTQISLENPSRMQNRRIKETIGIRYNDASKMALIVE